MIFPSFSVGGDRVRLNINGISVETTFSNKAKLVEDLTVAANGNALVSEFVTNRVRAKDIDRGE